MLGAALMGAALLFFFPRGVAAGRLAAATPTPAPVAHAGDVVLCPPGVYPAGYAVDCVPWGASAYLGRMASVGYLYPPDPLPARPLPPSWNALPGQWHYAWVRKDGGRALYPGLEAAAQGDRPRHFRPGFVYVSYTSVTSYKYRTYYLVDPRGWWMRGRDLQAVTPSSFHGLLFSATPERPFGWMVRTMVTRTVPGYGSRYHTHHVLQRYEVVQVYAQRQANGITWYMVAPDEWIPQTAVGLVFPRAAPPPGLQADRWIEVNLFEQTLAVYDEGKLRFATLVSTGEPPFWTPPGLFQIYKKLETTQMRGAFAADKSDYYQLEDVPWTMYYDKTRALHGAYWHDMFGYKTSHGCVNLSIADAHWLYTWARLGDWVYVWDPSGQTPAEGGGGGP